MTGTQAEHAKTKALERRFSAAASGGVRRGYYTEVKVALLAWPAKIADKRVKSSPVKPVRPAKEGKPTL